MSEVKRFLPQKTPIGTVMKESPEGYWVQASDFDAQRLRADTAEAERDALRMHLAEARLLLREIRQECNHSRLRDGQIDNFLHKSSSVTENPNAAEQRIAEIVEFIRDAADSAQSKGMLKAFINQLDAALNPNPEAESHEVAREALKMDNQRITPVRFKCLACGEYHEGSGNLPCPKMTPYAGSKP